MLQEFTQSRTQSNSSSADDRSATKQAPRDTLAKKQPQRWPISKDYDVIWPPEKRKEQLRRALLAAAAVTEVENMRCSKGLEKLSPSPCKNHECEWYIAAPFYNNCAHHAMQADGHTLEELGHILSLTRERVRQIETKALQHSKSSLEKFEEKPTKEAEVFTEVPLESLETRITAKFKDRECSVCGAESFVLCQHKRMSL